MYELYPYFTNDGSVGLFSPDADDIYHSTYGALTEAYEKFILPSNLNSFLKNNNEIKILDICFGIGYNSKSFLNYILDFPYNETIYTDKIKYSDKIGTNNKKFKVYIHAIDTDKNLACLSPFFISNKKNIKNNNLSFRQEKIQRMLSQTVKAKYELKPEVNILLLEKIIDQIDNEVISILSDKKYAQYFDKNVRALFEVLTTKRYKYSPVRIIKAFLHNIHYKYISGCNKMALKALKLMEFNFKLNIDDARQAIKNDNEIYNYIFLDAFTPVKCPCLWTVDFFKLLYSHLDENGMILTYSNSALVRNAFLNAGFHVGKIFSQSADKFTGTVAVKNKSLIKYELSEYDLGLMKTKAGIFYRDENLTLDNEAIIALHEKEAKNSDLISSSKFIKMNKLKK